MTGTGTQNDPFIVSSVDDLYALRSVSDAAKYARLGCDIDFNGTSYAESPEPVYLCCREFDGSGFCIRNIYINKPGTYVKVFILPYYSAEPTIKNLRLENIELIGDNISLIYADSRNSLKLYNCTFSVNIRRMDDYPPYQSNYRIIAGGEITSSMELCTIAVGGHFKRQYTVIGNSQISRCHIHLDISIGTGDASDGSYNSLMLASGFTDSYITGRVSADSQLTDNTNMSSGCTFDNFYTALEYINQNDVHWKGTMNSTCFYDKELAGNRDFTDQRTYYGLTTAQCKSASYLSSIGFLVAEDE